MVISRDSLRIVGVLMRREFDLGRKGGRKGNVVKVVLEVRLGKWLK